MNEKKKTVTVRVETHASNNDVSVWIGSDCLGVYPDLDTAKNRADLVAQTLRTVGFTVFHEKRDIMSFLTGD